MRAEQPKGVLEQGITWLTARNGQSDIERAQHILIVKEAGGDIYPHQEGVFSRRPSGARSLLEARREAILSCHNPLSMALMLHLDTYNHTPSELVGWFRETYRSTSFSELNDSHIPRYADALVNFGLVQRAQDGITISPAGIHYGGPIFARFLAFQAQENYPLVRALGQYQASGEVRAPFARAQIIVTSPDGSFTARQLSQQLPYNDGVLTDSFQALKRGGIINFNPEKKVQGTKPANYELCPIAQNEQVRGSLSQLIYAACIELTVKGARINQRNVLRILPEDYKQLRVQGSKHGLDSLRQDINHKLKEFEGQKRLRRLPEINSDMDTPAMLTERGLKLKNELLIPLDDALQDGETLDRWRRQYYSHVKERLPDVAAITGESFYPYSRGVIRQNRGRFLSEIERIVAEYEERLQNDPDMDADLTTRDVAEMLELNIHTASSYVLELVTNGRIRREGTNNFYHLRSLKK